MLRTTIPQKLCIAAVMTAALSAGYAAPAQASATPGGEIGPGQSVTEVDPETGLETTLSLGQPDVVSTRDITDDESLSAKQKSELLQASTRGTVRSNHWSQFVTGIAYTNTQDGTFYYDGSRVWVTQTYAGKKGSHRCFSNYVISPYAITNISKSDSGSTTSRSLKCSWNVKQAGLPIVTSWSMTAVVSKAGGISGGGSSVG